MKALSDLWQSGLSGKLIIGCSGVMLVPMSCLLVLLLINLFAPNRMAQQFLAIFEPNEQRVVSETSEALLALGPDPSSIVMDSPEGTAYQVFTANLTNDEAAMSKFFGEFATNTCRQDNGSLVGCMAAIYNSRGLQTLQEWDVRGEDPNELDEIVYFASITTYWAENDTCLQVVFTLVRSQRIWAITDPPTEVSTC